MASEVTSKNGFEMWRDGIDKVVSADRWNLRNLMLVCLSLVVALPTAAAGKPFPAQGERSFREACSQYSEAEMRGCLSKQARDSAQALAQAETDVQAALSRWDEAPRYVGAARAKFAASRQAFAKYREAQCGFAASLGGGAIGNALEMQRFACLAELNGRRAKQLRDAAAGLPAR